MYLLNLFLLYLTIPCLIANNITILTDWKKDTLKCINHFFENTNYLLEHNTNFSVSGLNEKGESVIHNVFRRNTIKQISEYHKFDYLPQEQSQEYYTKLIHILNQRNKILIFGEKSQFSDIDFFQQNNKNVEIIWCKNGECENCGEQKPMALAIVNKVSESKNVGFNEQTEQKNVASDKSWSDETKTGAHSFTLELSPFSTLTAVPGEIVKLYFRVINKHWIPLQYNFHCSDQMGLIRSVLPTSIILPPKSAPFDVMVVLEVAGPEGSTDQISFSVLQPEFELIKVNFYIGKLTADTTRPTIDYTFNGDCRSANSPHNCASEKWSIEGTIQDDKSGLAIISSIPNNLRFRNEFNIGTKEPVIVYYTATCCLPKVEIIATDLRGNTHKKTIDAEKQYLNIEEIGLIILLAIILLFVILFIILVIIKCRQRKRSRDFLSS